MEAGLERIREGAAPGAHTVKVFDRDLDDLRAAMCEMGGRVEVAIGGAMAALRNRDVDGAAAIVGDGARITAMAEEIERRAVGIIATRAPVADDLRAVVAALRMAGLAERMGGCALNIARRVDALSGCAEVGHLRLIPELERRVLEMVKAALDAFAARDPVAAAQVIARDDEVDALYAAVFRALVEHMTRHHSSITSGTHLLFVAQKLERIGDHAAAMARIVRFAATGSYAEEE